MRSQWIVLCSLGLALTGCGASSPPPPSAPIEPADGGRSLFQQGTAAARRGDSVRAEQYLMLAMERGYPREQVLPLLLQVCLSSSRLRAALDHAESYLREHPDNDGLRYLVAAIYASLGQYDAARIELEQLLQSRPDNPDARYLAGVVASDVDSEEAREHFRAYLDVAPRGRHAAEIRSRLSKLAIEDSVRERALVRVQPTEALSAPEAP